MCLAKNWALLAMGTLVSAAPATMATGNAILSRLSARKAGPNAGAVAGEIE